VTAQVWRAGAPDTAAPAQEAGAVFHGDSVTLRSSGPNAGPEQTIAAPGALPYINLSGAMLEQFVRRARSAGLTSVPMLLGNGTVTNVGISWLGADSATLAVAGVQFWLALDSAGRILSASVPAQGIRFVRVAEVGLSLTPLARPKPDYSAPAGAPYTAEEVVVAGPAGKLAGTLTLPRARRGRVPAVVTITGSGGQERDEAIPIAPASYRPIRQIADTLSRRGIAVLRLDDRGMGGSDRGPSDVTTEDFARDIEAAVAWLRTRPEIDPARIGLVGHSEGGMIAPMVAAADPRIRAIVLMAGGAFTGRRISETQNRYLLAHQPGLSGARLDSAVAAAMVKADSIAPTNPWIAFYWRYDPLVAARKVHAPVLILQGATDRQVTAEQAGVLGQAFRAGGNRDVTVRVFPDRDHLFLRDPSGDFAGYAKLPGGAIDGEVLGTLADWAAARLGAGGPAAPAMRAAPTRARGSE
jgi:dienelactone hydrolase